MVVYLGWLVWFRALCSNLLLMCLLFGFVGTFCYWFGWLWVWVGVWAWLRSLVAFDFDGFGMLCFACCLFGLFCGCGGWRVVWALRFAVAVSAACWGGVVGGFGVGVSGGLLWFYVSDLL